jgi:hypothetical protein
MYGVLVASVQADLSYEQLVINDGPFAYYRLGETSVTDTVHDEMGVHHGFFYRNPTVGVAGPIMTDPDDTAVQFNRANTSYVAVGTLADFGTRLFEGFAVEFWLKSNNGTSTQTIMGTNNPGYTTAFIIDVAYTKNTGELRIYFRDEDWNRYQLLFYSGSDGAEIFDDTWHHIVYSFDPTISELKDRVSLYVDGQQRSKSRTTLGGEIPDSFSDFVYSMTIGCWNNRGKVKLFLDGSLDEVAFYTRPLSREEVESHFSAALGEPAWLEITGPNQVPENFKANYQAIAHYDSNGTRDVTELANWTVEPETMASIDVGTLSIAPIDSFEEQIDITAQYSEDGTTVDAQKEVSVYAVRTSGSALYFDGVNDYVDSNDFDLAENFTVCLWLDPTTTADGQCFIGKNTSGGSNIFLFGFWVGGYSLRIWSDLHVEGIKTTGWQHLVVVGEQIDSTHTNVSLYRNSEILWTYTLDDVVGDMSGKGWTIGQEWDAHERTNFFEGTIDEVAIFNQALSPEEIRSNMRTKMTGEETDLAACWDFDEGEGQFVYDLSGNNNHGWLGSTPFADHSDPAWVESDAPLGGWAVPVGVDIKPGSCPNPLNAVSRGVVPVAVLGANDVDVSTIDVVSIRLAGVGPIRSSFEDVATAAADGNECECAEEGPDGHVDLTLKFETQKVVEALGELNDGDVLTLTLTGVLQDGTPIEGADCIVVRGKSKPFNKADIDKDGIVNVSDFADLAKYWLESEGY